MENIKDGKQRLIHLPFKELYLKGKYCALKNTSNLKIEGFTTSNNVVRGDRYILYRYSVVHSMG